MPILHNLPGKILAAFIFVLPCFVQATTYYWKPTYVSETFDDTQGYGKWTSLSNWSTESEDGANAAALPGSSDVIYGSTKNAWRQFDLEGGEWTIGGWFSTGDWDRHYLCITNGTLHWAGIYTTHSDTVHLDSGAHFIFDVGSQYSASYNHGAADYWYVHSGASLAMFGFFDAYNAKITVDDGGTMDLCPSRLDLNLYTAQTCWIDNSGLFYATNGITFSGSGANNGAFEILQKAGTMVLGGPVTKDGKNGAYRMVISGGTVRTVGDVSIDFTSATATAPFTLQMDAGSSFDLSGLSFNPGVTVTKTGAGDLAFCAGHMPDLLEVTQGGIALTAPDTSYDLSDMTFASGSKIKIGASGVTLSDWDSSISSASFAVVDGFVPASGVAVFTCSDATILAQAQSGLNASLSGTGVTVDISGNSLVSESHYTFNSSTVTDMNDANGWVNNVAALAGQPVTIAGSSTRAVMDDNVPVYSAISVEGGASFTVAATRDVPATTLAAGTTFAVANSGHEMQTQTYSGYIGTTDTLVGTMVPSLSITMLEDISGCVGGASWATGYLDTPYARADVSVAEDGAKLRVQFKRWESPYTKCVIVEFWKDASGNIYAKVVKASYLWGSEADYDHNFSEDGGFDIATSDGQGGYGVKGVSLSAPVPGSSAVTVTATGDFVTAGSGSVAVDVAANCVLDLSGVDVTTAATLVKTGDGAIIFGNELPTALNVTDGVLVLQPYVEYDMSAITVAGGVAVKVFSDGEIRTAFGSVQQNDKMVYMPVGTYIGGGTWSTTANWVGSEIPDASMVVRVHGEGTVLVLDDDSVTLPAGIVVEDGATLKVTASVTMPPLTLAPTARLEIGDNGEKPATVVQFDSDPMTSYRISGETVLVPSFAVATNATITFSYRRARLKNMNMTLCGLATTTAALVGNITFGYAANGETSYFGLYADGATFHPLTYSWDSGTDFGSNYAWPDVGGRVVQLRPYYFVRCTFPCVSWADFADSRFGVNNPADEPCEFIFDNTEYHHTYRIYVGSVAELRFINGATLSPGHGAGHISGHQSQANDYASIELDGTGSYLSSFGEATRFSFQPAEAGHETVILKNGASIKGFHLEGNGKAALAVYEGEWSVPKKYSSGDPLPVLSGFGSAIVKEGGVFSIVGRNDGSSNTGTWTAWDRDLVVAAPITGAGDVVVSNAVAGNSMAITVTSAANTCSGAISCNGDNDCRLLFADGANWAGTVVAGSVALTNTTEDAASAVSFNAVNLAGDFPIRVWKDGGTIVANDTLNVGSYVNNGGKLVPTGAEFALGDQIVVGKIAKNAVLPSAAPGWIAKIQPLDGDDENDELLLKRGCGLQVLVR